MVAFRNARAHRGGCVRRHRRDPIRGAVPGPRYFAAASVTIALLVIFISHSFAITDEDVYRIFGIPATVPGARAASMGGAGLALIEDATASRINPARLAAVMQPQFILEVRKSDLDDSSSSSGFQQFDPSINPFAGSMFTTSDSPDDDASPAFLAYAHPLELAGHLVLGVSRTEIMDLSVRARTESRTTPLSAPLTPSAGD